MACCCDDCREIQPVESRFLASVHEQDNIPEVFSEMVAEKVESLGALSYWQWFVSFLTGIYWLTLAKYTEPLKHQLAKLILDESLKQMADDHTS